MELLYGLIPLALLAALAARGMIAAGLMDMPGGRKAHARPTPSSGGVAVVLAVLVAPSLLPALRAPPIPAVLVAAAGLGLVGWLDDRRPWPAGAKLAAQCLAAGLAVAAAGVPVAWALPAVLWIVAVTNAFNFMDGMDGLAPGVALLAGLVMGLLAQGGAGALGLALAAGLAGFLPFNWPRARLFLGDAGSQPVGFLLGCMAVLAPASGPEPPFTPQDLPFMPQAMMLAGLLFDTGVTLLRRAWAGARLTAAHRGHLYQTARLPAVAVAMLHWAFVAWGAACWLAPVSPLPRLVLVLAPQLAWLGFVRGRVRSAA